MTWLPQNLAVLQSESRPEPTVSGVAYPGSRVLISGEPESLKSWLAAVVTADTLRRGDRVVWVDFEQGPTTTRERFLELGVTVDQLANVHYFQPREPLSDEGRVDLVEHVRQVQPAVAVFDAYAGLLGVFDHDPSSERDIERVNRHVIDVFRDAGTTVLTLDHVVKARDNRARYSSGSGRKLAEVEVHLGLERVEHFARGSMGMSRIRNHKDRLGGLAHPLLGEFHLSSDPDTFAVTWDIKPHFSGQSDGIDHFRPTGLMEKVSRYLANQGEPVSKNAIEAHVKGKGDYVRKAIDCLIHEGHAAASEGPRRAILVTHVQPYREADDHVPAEPHNQADSDLVPVRPDLIPTSSPTLPLDFVPRPPSLGGDEDEVMGGAG